MKTKLPFAALLLGACLLPVTGFTADTAKSSIPPSANETPGATIKDNGRADASHRSVHPVDDSVITSKIKGKLIKDKKTRTDNVEIETVDGAVTLTGSAKSKTNAAHAVALARQVKGVKSVKNDIQITPPEKVAAVDKTSDKEHTADKRRSDQPVDDTWITTKVKAKFVEDKQVSATDVHVKTLNGVVELTGNAKSMEESSKAASLARDIKGVKSVTNNIKVM
jgi:hyperosmotically inducible protein